jgi:hypothetical protein
MRINCNKLVSVSFRHLSSRKNKIVLKSSLDTLSVVKSPWKELPDPNGSHLTYFWNKETNEATQLGAVKPKNWLQVKDPNGSELLYWWDPESDETTALGTAKPHWNGSIQQQQPPNPFPVRNEAPMTFGRSMKVYFTLGVGMTLGMCVVRMIFG